MFAFSCDIFSTVSMNAWHQICMYTIFSQRLSVTARFKISLHPSYHDVMSVVANNLALLTHQFLVTNYSLLETRSIYFFLILEGHRLWMCHLKRNVFQRKGKIYLNHKNSWMKIRVSTGISYWVGSTYTR